MIKRHGEKIHKECKWSIMKMWGEISASLGIQNIQIRQDIFTLLANALFS